MFWCVWVRAGVIAAFIYIHVGEWVPGVSSSLQMSSHPMKAAICPLLPLCSPNTALTRREDVRVCMGAGVVILLLSVTYMPRVALWMVRELCLLTPCKCQATQ